MYRGKGAAKALEKHRHGGKYYIEAPSFPGYEKYAGQKLDIVHVYKHLGSIVAIDGSDVADANAKACTAMSAYAPLSCKVFGSCRVSY